MAFVSSRSTDAFTEPSLPPLIPRALLFGNPERVSPQLSPDGKRLAYLAPRDGVLNVYVRTVGQENDQPITDERVRPVRALVWLQNSRQIAFPQDVNGDENFHVFLADADTGTVTDLTPFDNVRAALIATAPEKPDALIVQTNQRDNRLMDAYRLDLATGERALVGENPGSVVGWEADNDLRVRVALATTPDGGAELWVRDDETTAWRTALAVPFGETVSPVAFGPDNQTLYVQTDKGVNTLRLYALDVATGALTLLHAREDVDLNAVLIHPTRHTVQTVGYNRARQEWDALDEEIAPDLETLRGLFAGDFSVISRSRDDATWLVQETRDDGPVRYHVYDRATRAATFLFSARPALENVTLAKMKPVEIAARDGLVLPAYLSLPPNVPPANLPLVLVVHGGPWARDSWGMSGDVQWLANRGYAVLQVNYRGSTGFGKAHTNEGNREWAAKMHDDLIDAVAWTVQQGYADPARVAIYGGSYGGYAALVGATFTPETFACAVDVVGPSNLLTLLASIPPYWEPLRAQFQQRVGDPADANFLKSRSPLFFADRIVRPLLIAQGAHDPRVKQAESDQIVSAMRANGQEVTYLLFNDEGHGFARPENRIKFCAAAEKFLADHLGGRCEPAHAGEEPPLA